MALLTEGGVVERKAGLKGIFTATRSIESA